MKCWEAGADFGFTGTLMPSITLSYTPIPMGSFYNTSSVLSSGVLADTKLGRQMALKVGDYFGIRSEELQ